MLMGITSLAGLLLYLFAAKTSLDKAFYLLVLSSVFTTTSVFNIGNNSILLYQPLWLIVAIRTFWLYRKEKRAPKLIWLPFLAVCLFSIPLALFNGDVKVTDIDGMHTNVKFSIQQFTQYAYLFIAISTTWITAYLLKMKIIEWKKVQKAILLGFAFVITVAILQRVVPVEIMNQTIRNSCNTNYNFTMQDRLSGPFNEPSMLSLYLLPLMACIVAKLAANVAPKDRSLPLVILLLVAIIICFSNQSSSAFLGFAVIMLLTCIAMYKKVRKASSKAQILVALAIVIGFCLLLSSGVLEEPLSAMISKFQGQGESGSIRMDNLMMGVGVFLSHPILGIGWGTIRTESLLATWLAEIGLVGFTAFIVPLLAMMHAVRNESEGISLPFVFYFVTYLVILFISVGEPYYLTPYFIAGMMQHVVTNQGEVLSWKSACSDKEDN